MPPGVDGNPIHWIKLQLGWVPLVRHKKSQSCRQGEGAGHGYSL